jgi:plastocyanin
MGLRNFACAIGPRALMCVGLLTIVQACGGTPSGPSAPDATVTIGPSGISPAEVRIKAWGHVLFVNNDSRPHTIASDPVELHSDCPPINDVGFLNPGQSRLTGTLNEPRVCGFHDHNNEFDPTLKGRIVVQ